MKSLSAYITEASSSKENKFWDFMDEFRSEHGECWTGIKHKGQKGVSVVFDTDICDLPERSEIEKCIEIVKQYFKKNGWRVTKVDIDADTPYINAE